MRFRFNSLPGSLPDGISNRKTNRAYTALAASFALAVLPLSGCYKSIASESSKNTSLSGNTSNSQDDFFDELENEYETSTENVATTEIVVEEFSAEDLRQWKERMFKGSSSYRPDVVDQRSVLEAKANASASLLFRQQLVNLEKSPVLKWTWKISNTYQQLASGQIDERSRGGDDFPARVYVVFRDGPLPSNALAINYVWASGETTGTYWPNPYQKNAIMMVVESGDARAGQWVSHERNVAEDFKRLFGKDISTLHGYAVMVDGDNTGNTTTSWFDRLSFSAAGGSMLQ